MPPARVLNGYVVRHQQTTPPKQASLPCLRTDQPTPNIRLSYVGTQEAGYVQSLACVDCTTSSACDRQGHLTLLSFRSACYSPCFCIPRPGSSSPLLQDFDLLSRLPNIPTTKKKGGPTTRAGLPTTSPLLLSAVACVTRPMERGRI